MAYQEKSFGNVKVHIYVNRDEMGKAAAEHVVGLIRQVLKEKQTASMVFAAAPSQDEFLSYLTQSREVDWSHVVGFHMDEYIGLPATSDQFFSLYLQNHLFSKVRTGTFASRISGYSETFALAKGTKFRRRAWRPCGPIAARRIANRRSKN